MNLSCNESTECTACFFVTLKALIDPGVVVLQCGDPTVVNSSGFIKGEYPPGGRDGCS